MSLDALILAALSLYFLLNLYTLYNIHKLRIHLLNPSTTNTEVATTGVQQEDDCGFGDIETAFTTTESTDADVIHSVATDVDALSSASRVILSLSPPQPQNPIPSLQKPLCVDDESIRRTVRELMSCGHPTITTDMLPTIYSSSNNSNTEFMNSEESRISNQPPTVEQIAIPPGPLGIVIGRAVLTTSNNSQVHGIFVFDININSPCKSLIRTGDRLTSINNYSLAVKTTEEVKALLKNTSLDRILGIVRCPNDATRLQELDEFNNPSSSVCDPAAFPPVSSLHVSSAPDSVTSLTLNPSLEMFSSLASNYPGGNGNHGSI
jgi:hypothetical protein